MTKPLHDFAQWQRVKWVALFYYLAQSVRGVVSNVLYAIPLLLAIRSSVEQHPWYWLLGLSIGMLILVTYIVALYLAFQFRIQDNKVDIKKGVFNKTRLSIPFDKIQDVRIEQPFYYRFSGCCVVQLDTAGSNKQEAVITALPLTEAESLRQVVQQTASPVLATEASDKPEPLITRSVRDIVIHGLTNNRVLIIVGALYPILNNLMDNAEGVLFGVDLQHVFSLEQQSLLSISISVLLGAIVVLGVVAGISVIGALVSYYDYKLFYTDDRLKQSSGLLTRYQASVKTSRIQHIEYKRDWLDSLVNRLNLKFKQIDMHDEQATGGGKSILVPSIDIDQSFAIASVAFAHQNPFTLTYSRISRRFILRYIIIAALIMALLSAYFHATNVNILSTGVLTGGLMLSAMFSMLIVLRWYRWGFYSDTQHLYIRKGLFGYQYSVYPLFKAQKALLKQSVWLKRNKLANLSLAYASGHATVVFIPEHAATAIIDRTLLNINSSHRPWM